MARIPGSQQNKRTEDRGNQNQRREGRTRSLESGLGAREE